MDLKLENLIEKIKKQGVESGKKASDEIIQKATEEAEAIVKKAKKEADQYQKEAEKETRQFRENAELAIKQAARDSELLLKERITDLFDSILKQEVAKALTADVMKDLIIKIAGKWSSKTDMEIVLSNQDKKKLKDTVLRGLKKRSKDSLTIQASPDLSHGFRIGIKDDNIYYDFSDESIAAMLKLFLNAELKELLDRNG